MRPNYTGGEYRPADIERLWRKIAKGDGCWPWQAAVFRSGYGRMSYGVVVDGLVQHRHVLAHRMAYEVTYGPVPDGVYVLHRCDNRACCRPDHLFLGDHHDNMADMVSKGRAAAGERSPRALYPERTARGDRHGRRLHPETAPRGDQNGSRTRPESRPRGEANTSAKLNPDLVRAIRQQYAANTISQLSRDYGVSRAAIKSVVNRRTWTHIE